MVMHDNTLEQEKLDTFLATIESTDLLNKIIDEKMCVHAIWAVPFSTYMHTQLPHLLSLI